MLMYRTHRVLYCVVCVEYHLFISYAHNPGFKECVEVNGGSNDERKGAPKQTQPKIRKFPNAVKCCETETTGNAM
jgi:hypothetical protein